MWACTVVNYLKKKLGYLFRAISKLFLLKCGPCRCFNIFSLLLVYHYQGIIGKSMSIQVKRVKLHKNRWQALNCVKGMVHLSYLGFCLSANSNTYCSFPRHCCRCSRSGGYTWRSCLYSAACSRIGTGLMCKIRRGLVDNPLHHVCYDSRSIHHISFLSVNTVQNCLARI